MNTLWLMPRGLHHVVWVCWDRKGAHLGWYVNFQRPYEREGATIQYMDYALDLRVAPDGTATWKDEDDLAQLTSRGLVSPETVRSMRAEGEELSRSALRHEPPFDERWNGWHPDPAWPPPVLDPRWSLPGLGSGEDSRLNHGLRRGQDRAVSTPRRQSPAVPVWHSGHRRCARRSHGTRNGPCAPAVLCPSCATEG